MWSSMWCDDKEAISHVQVEQNYSVREGGRKMAVTMKKQGQGE
jgi:hypothetical protein